MFNVWRQFKRALKKNDVWSRCSNLLFHYSLLCKSSRYFSSRAIKQLINYSHTAGLLKRTLLFYFEKTNVSGYKELQLVNTITLSYLDHLPFVTSRCSATFLQAESPACRPATVARQPGRGWHGIKLNFLSDQLLLSEKHITASPAELNHVGIPNQQRVWF